MNLQATAFGYPEAGVIEPFYLSRPGTPAESRMLGCAGACRGIRGSFRPLSLWGNGEAQPAGGNAIERKRTGVYTRCCFGVRSPRRAMRPVWASGVRGGGVEHSQFFGTSAESSGSVARTISSARMVSHPEPDLRAEDLALRDEAFAQGNLDLRLKASTGQVSRILATEARPGIKGRRLPPPTGEV